MPLYLRFSLFSRPQAAVGGRVIPRANRVSSGRGRRRWGIWLLVITALFGTAHGQEATPSADGDAVALPRELAEGFTDRTAISAPGQPLTEALSYTFSLSPDRLAEAAGQYAEGRRNVLSQARGETVDDFSTIHDLLRFPDVNRGRPVQVNGVVRDVDMQEFGEQTLPLVRLMPVDAPGGQAAVILPAEVTPPSERDRILVAGLFLNITVLEEEDGSTTTAALIAAPDFENEAESSDLLPGRSLWSVVEHRTLGVRSTESGLYYRLLSDAASADAAELRNAAADQIARRRAENPQLAGREPFPVFVDMFQNPTAYEGQPVTLNGYAREIRKYPAGENAVGLQMLYEAWVYTDDSQGNPAVVVAAGPDDVPLGGDLQVPMRVTGYFFKIYGYEAHDTTRVAPMILAGHLDVLPEPSPARPPWWFLALFAGIFGALILWLAVSYFGSRRRVTRVAADDTPPDFTQLE